MKKLLIIIILTLLSFGLRLQAQSIEGHVYESTKTGNLPLYNAVVFWQGTTIFALTDSVGYYKIAPPPQYPYYLKASLMGFTSDSVNVINQTKIDFVLQKGVEQKTVLIEGEKEKTGIGYSKVEYQQTITSGEIRRAACCNLSESFETNASVDVNYSDAVSGAKQIRMLGLDGVYTQILQENIPTLKGIANTYGLSYIPGPWIQSIQITKGAGSVVNGFESMAGQINVELQKPFDSEKLFAYLYADEMGRGEANAYLTKIINGKLATNLMLHGSFLPVKNDRNKDGFLDAPLFNQYNFLNKWEYFDGKKLELQFGVEGLHQDRQGGQVNFNPMADKLTTNHYGIGANTQRWEAFSKIGFLSESSTDKSTGIQFNVTHHTQNNYFGLNTYNGLQKQFYGNVIHQNKLGSHHLYKFGGSFSVDDLEEKTHISSKDSTYKTQEYIPGIFGEYTFLSSTKFIAVGGLRGDYHNNYGFFFTPRIHLKYSPYENLTLRLSTGKGYRTPHIFTENQTVWASSRQLYILDKPTQEVSWNSGGSLTQNINFGKRKGFISIDYFYTFFEKQTVIDLEQSPQQIMIYNLAGQSYANSFQAEVSLSPIKNLELRTAWKYYEVKTTYNGKLLDKPFVPKQRFLFTTSYATQFKKWIFDGTALWFGSSRIPSTETNPMEYKLNYRSPAYWIFHLQVTRNFKNWSIFAGAENLLDYRQPNPILAYEKPFSNYFDASMIWGPVDGRRIYAGLRFKIID
ncbi:MAG: TonB-dependent receptor [Bacteroidetes bacterium]|nr:TonB-dependent receptor [Bacteroidota bacterium]